MWRLVPFRFFFCYNDINDIGVRSVWWKVSSIGLCGCRCLSVALSITLIEPGILDWRRGVLHTLSGPECDYEPV